MRKTENANKNTKRAKTSWKAFLKFYTKVNMPWHLFIATAIMGFGITKVNLMIVPYTAAINKGAIAKAGFLKGFLFWTVAAALVSLTYNLVWGFCSMITNRNIRKKVWAKLLRMPVAEYDKEDPQSFVSRITSDAEKAVSAPASVISFFASCYGLIIAYTKMNEIYSDLAKLILFVAPVALIVIAIIGKFSYKINLIVQNAISLITSYFGERLSNVYYIKSTSMENEEYETGIKASQEKYKADLVSAVLGSLQVPIGYIAQYAIMIIVFAGGALYVRRGQMDISGLVDFYSYSGILMPSFFEIVTQWQNIKGSHGATAKIAALMEIQNEVTDGKISMNRPDEDINFKEVVFSYDNENAILHGIDFTIPKSKKTVVLGSNGSGKTTIFKLIERFYNPQQGEVSFGNDNIFNIKLDEWRAAIGYVSQNSHLISGTIRDNIAYGTNHDYSEKEIIRAAKLANAYDFIMELEDGFDTYVSQVNCKMSGGEKQRIAIARVIMKDPDYLLLDETTSSLDIICRQDVIKALRNLMEGRTTIMISHDMALVKDADHIVVVKDGSVEAEGSYEEALAVSPSFQKFIALQQIK
ncbi:ABC transporter ATP-binding protein [Clostridium sp. YIM B02515]|uniref:ABC transporter ATP-binding protein n=1 Tax=Clostridium rhizosphaerae TaxID=2803861 RepID=A0ABS1TJB5_9CLOT|nr:ABC transporter ATP-binding protein [Clostridium rhizosphaerae]MBL4938063.1 ABC transporter ATP-binding protein [Clostridium rhizosphaerae]